MKRNKVEGLFCRGLTDESWHKGYLKPSCWSYCGYAVSHNSHYILSRAVAITPKKPLRWDLLMVLMGRVTILSPRVQTTLPESPPSWINSGQQHTVLIVLQCTEGGWETSSVQLWGGPHAGVGLVSDTIVVGSPRLL